MYQNGLHYNYFNLFMPFFFKLSFAVYGVDAFICCL
jgi:hypothetical protein